MVGDRWRANTHLTSSQEGMTPDSELSLLPSSLCKVKSDAIESRSSI